jgi:hypothetical protein
LDDSSCELGKGFQVRAIEFFPQSFVRSDEKMKAIELAGGGSVNRLHFADFRFLPLGS